MMNLKETIKSLESREARSKRDRYFGDASERAFRRHVLILLSRIADNVEVKKKKKKKPSQWNRFVGEYLRKGKTIQEAARDWEKKKEIK